MHKEIKDAAPSYAGGGYFAGKASAKDSGPELKKPKKSTKPKRVKMVNTRTGNGEIGGIAQPLEKDVPAWEARGWVRA